MAAEQHSDSPPVIAVNDLTVEIRSDRGAYPVVADMALAVRPGETLCIVGESGCGKSMTALSLLRLLPEAARVAKGEILIDGEDLLAMDEHRVEDLRGERIAMIFQEPLTALNPVLTIGEQIAESVRRHRKGGHRAAMQRTLETLQLVQMPDAARRAKQFPHELSGGLRQRAMIALALACDPRILVVDEPSVYELFDHPIHPYTLGLMGAIPRSVPGRPAAERLTDISGTVPPPWDLPVGCAFAPRCPGASARCFAERPPFEEQRPGHFAACWEPVHDCGSR